jgi:hypothetical protein
MVDTKSNLDMALRLAALGWAVFPCTHDKKPMIKSAHPKDDPLHNTCTGQCGKDGHGYKDATRDRFKIQAWWATWPNALIGIACRKSGFFALDVDNKDGKHGSDELLKLIGDHPLDKMIGPTQKTPSGGYHILYKYPHGVNIPNNSDKLREGLDLRSDGYICTGPGYEWTVPPETAIPEPPIYLVDAIRAMNGNGSKPAKKPEPRKEYIPQGKAEKARAALERLAAWRCDQYDSWVNVGMALAELGQDGFSLWDEWSKRSAKYNAGEMPKKWASFDASGGKTIASLYHWANEDNPQSAAHSYIPPEPEYDNDWELNAIPPGETLDPLPQVDAQEKEHSRIETISADEILKTDWPAPVWAVPGLLPVGLSILAGAPKMGKSWLALQIALAVAAGGVALGQRVERGPILYLALEDPPRRLKERMNKQRWPMGLAADFLTVGTFMDRIGDLRNGGGKRLTQKIYEREYRLVVIDTLSRAISGKQNEAEEMTAWLTPVQEIAHAQNAAILMIDHHRKGKSEDMDAVTDVLGSTAKGAMCDTILGLYRERGKAGAHLALTGRDVEEKIFDLRMDWLTGCWQLDTSNMTEEQSELLKLLESIGPATVSDLASAINRNAGTVHKQLTALLEKGLAIQGVNKMWSVVC